MEKEVRIYIRIQKNRKENWKKLCKKKNISLSSLIIDSVENRILEDEERKVMVFIERQDNIFGKIENNINQIAKIANTQKFLSESEFRYFKKQLEKIIILKEQQNKIFLEIYSLFADDC